jgi:hypothetical protein
MSYDQITRDISMKAGDDVCAAIKRNMALVGDPMSKTMIAMFAAGQAFAIPAALLAHKMQAEPQAVMEALIDQIRPIIVDAIKANARG